MTRPLRELGPDNPEAAERLIPRLCGELRGLAGGKSHALVRDDAAEAEARELLDELEPRAGSRS